MFTDDQLRYHAKKGGFPQRELAEELLALRARHKRVRQACLKEWPRDGGKFRPLWYCLLCRRNDVLGHADDCPLADELEQATKEGE